MPSQIKSQQTLFNAFFDGLVDYWKTLGYSESNVLQMAKIGELLKASSEPWMIVDYQEGDVGPRDGEPTGQRWTQRGRALALTSEIAVTVVMPWAEIAVCRDLAADIALWGDYLQVDYTLLDQDPATTNEESLDSGVVYIADTIQQVEIPNLGIINPTWVAIEVVFRAINPVFITHGAVDEHPITPPLRRFTLENSGYRDYTWQSS